MWEGDDMILVTYASKHGSTEGIARRIAERLTEDGHAAEAWAVAEVIDLEGYDAVVLGSAVYAGSWMKEAVDFAWSHEAALNRVPVWIFSSGPLGSNVEDAEEQPRQLPDLRDRLHVRGHIVFFGALDPASLGFAERMIVKAVKAPQGDFRDWDAIDAWADEIAAFLT
jgi:menaquinone-dependent protoporphyrinogen oxidase